MSSTLQNPPGTSAEAGRPRLPGWVRSPTLLARLAAASIVANCAIVVTGGAVRLTKSGLGCPTWPRCTDDSLTPTAEYRGHGIIEFTNRQLTFVLALVALATLIVAVCQRPRDRRISRWAIVAFLGVPAQAVLGGVTVLTGLNPWTVAAHFLLSMVIIAVCVQLYWVTRHAVRPESADAVGAAVRVAGSLRLLTAFVVTTAALVLVVGTIVTGSGPHNGATETDKGVAHRTGLDAGGMSQLHADIVMVLIGLTIGMLLLAKALVMPRLVRATLILLAVELAQGVIGFVQYFTHLPVLLVGLHMAGACSVWVATLWAAHRAVAATTSSELVPHSAE